MHRRQTSKDGVNKSIELNTWHPNVNHRIYNNVKSFNENRVKDIVDTDTIGQLKTKGN